MDSSSERTFEDLLGRIERREQIARRRSIFYSLVPIAMAAILLAYTSYRIQSATTQVQDLENQAAKHREQVAELRSQITSLERQLKETEARLEEATDLSRYVHPIDLVDMKIIYSRYPREARILTQIWFLRDRGVRWRLGGQSPAEGFDSPSFAAFILRELNLPGGDVRPGESILATSRRLLERLPPTSRPRVGDLVFYPGGYALFYFVDRREQPFVIGMTPSGITALKPDFARAEAFRRVSE